MRYNALSKGRLLMYNMIQNGTIASPRGFTAGAAAAGIKYTDRLDLAVLCSEQPATAAGVFTRNPVRSAPVLLSARRIQRGTAMAVVANAGCANACTGARGLKDAETMTSLVAKRFGLSPEDVLVASTGVIGTYMPLDRISTGIESIQPDTSRGHDFAQAIMTTDTTCKEAAIHIASPEGQFTIGAAAKGSGMIHPNMGTLLCFVSTDAVVEPAFLRTALSRCVDRTFNMVSVDGDTSPSDTVLVFANGLAGNQPFDDTNGAPFEEALQHVCEYLAKAVAADGEGATKLLEVLVTGARTEEDARIAARTVASSMLVKCAIHGADPNWGRVICAAGRSGALIEPHVISMTLCGVPVMSEGMPVLFDHVSLRSLLAEAHVSIGVHLALGDGCATAWGCDLSHDYVTINASYTT